MDIVEKLRHPNRCVGDEYQSLGNLCHLAAHEIERLRHALKEIAEGRPGWRQTIAKQALSVDGQIGTSAKNAE
jgi:hypothetical protein